MTDAAAIRERARHVAAALAPLPGVRAIALGGSGSAGASDEWSDLDLYVYVIDAPPVAARREIAHRFADDPAIDLRQWEVGDAWRDRDTGRGVDVMYRRDDWITTELDRVLVHHQPSVGYTTAFWHNIRRCTPLHDPDGYLAALQRRADVPYPEPLRRAIVAHNHPLLRDFLFSFRHQTESAVLRGDWVSVQHRVAALLASYFDVLFALNRQTHPGEKRLVAYVLQLCTCVPDGFARDLDALLRAAAPGGGDVLGAVNALVDGLDAVLATESLLPPRDG